MKKKKLAIVCTIMLFFILAIGASYLKNRPIISMSRTVMNEEPVAAGCSVELKEPKKISVTYNSNIESGNVIIRLTDESWNTIKEFPSSAKGKESIDLDRGLYYVRVESEHFKGTYNVKVYD